jgi:glucose-6-phosphate isomerase
MTLDLRARWDRYKHDLCVVPSVGLTLDISRMASPGDLDAHLEKMSAPMKKAFDAMEALEKGAVANPDENRQVGHYWLRDPSRAPTAEHRTAIETTLASISTFAAEVHAGKIKSETGAPFTDLLVIGIGGSALGPQLVARALGTAADKLAVHFFDNTDPDGMDVVLSRLSPRLPMTLVVVVSKSGGTKETRNGMLEAKWAMERAHVTFARHAVAVTGEGSALDQVAKNEGWLARFPMWDWVGGRTSELSAVGLLPAALQGIDIGGMLGGARETDVATRVRDLRKNPAALLALMWHLAGNGKGTKDMVVLPYKDRIELFSRYLQQLVMESLGKEKDLDGKVVHQGIAVYGNKGSTDQHAYVQQLRDGVPNFFVTFLEVEKDAAHAHADVEPGITSGDYLLGFLLGTRRALYESGRASMTITLADVSPRSVGALIALFERAVGFYATLVNVNAYHQPGVEAGKKAATDVLTLQQQLVLHLAKGGAHDAEAIAKAIGSDDIETIYKVCMHLSGNPSRPIVREGDVDPAAPWTTRFKKRA